MNPSPRAALAPAPGFEPLPQEPAFSWQSRLQANAGAAPSARLRVRPRLTVANWSGDHDRAARIAARLVDNAVKHGRPFADDRIILRLAIAPVTRDLLIEVDDALPEFPGFQAVATGSLRHGSGLWWVTRYRGRLAWQVKSDDDGAVIGKTVQAVVSAGRDAS